MDQNSINGGTYNAPVYQAHSITVQAASPPLPEQPWARAVLTSGIWAHAAPHEVEPYRAHAVSLAARLAAITPPAGDPWADPGFAGRFADRLEWLLGSADGGIDLYPAEAGVLILLPYIHQAQQSLLVASRLAAEPTSLRPRMGATGLRAQYQSFLTGHDLLVNRAELRPEAAPAIGWWLYRRWLLREANGTEHLASLVADPGPLGEALQPRRLTRFLTGLRLGAEVCHAEHLAQLEADEVLPGPGAQRFRERRAALLLAVAYGAAIEPAVLPETVVEHIGVPNPVDLDGLRRTLAGISWGGSPKLPVLKAVCEHEAVVEALREHAGRLDGLLLAVGRTGLQPMPTRISADGIVPAEGTFSSGARFQLNDRRMLGLLTGDQLYKDRDLAVRELYQNALDACRYRQARTEYLERSGRPFHPYEGRISFVQGVDEDGREYFECEDDGIGMGEAELRGVFSHAGARFADQPDFLLEQAAWEQVDPPVRLYPNSRFGIGVLAYFMLADEIRVTSCRMGLDGMPGPVVEAHILGPNHLFRITETAKHGRPGTRVRLYLRDKQRWSGLDALAKVLAVAEFRTTVVHRKRQREWAPGEYGLPGSQASSVEWEGSPPGAQVIWRADEGRLLVDGLRIKAGQPIGVLSGLHGVVVNLTRNYAPRHLSTDRLTVLDDISPQVEELLAAAAPSLIASEAEFLDLIWMQRVAKNSPRTADLVAEAAFRAGVGFGDLDHPKAPAAAGCFPPDRAILDELLIPHRRSSHEWHSVTYSIPAHLLLWRLLALGDTPLARELTTLVPELAEPRQVLRARPSDEELLSGSHQAFGHPQPAGVFALARRLGCHPAGLADRQRRFGVSELVLPVTCSPGAQEHSDMAWLNQPYMHRLTGATIGDLLEVGDHLGVSVAEAATVLESYGIAVRVNAPPDTELDETDLQLLHQDGVITDGRWHQGPVPPGHVAQAALRTGLSPAEVRRRLERYGLEVEPFEIPEQPDQSYVAWLSADHNGQWPWLCSTEPVSPWQLLAVQDWLHLPADDVRAEFQHLGFTLPPEATCEEAPGDLELLAGEWDEEMSPFRTDRVPSFVQLLGVAQELGISLRTLTKRLADYQVHTGLNLPQRPTELDRELIRYDDLTQLNPDLTPMWSYPWWLGLSPEDEIPFFRLVLAARDLGRRPKELVTRLRSYGLRVSHDDLPSDLTHREALRLLTTDDRSLPTSAGRPMPLVQLVRIARSVDLPITETARHLRDLGVNVGDVAETVREALARVPLE